MEVLQRTANRGSISTGYDIDNSLKLNSASSEYLYITRDASGSDWNRLLWTASMWVKHIPTESSATSPKERLFGAADANSDFDIRFRGQPLGFRNNSDVDGVGELRTNALYRDYSAWMHIVAVWDTANGTAGNRMRLYVNGEEVTSFSTDTQPSQNEKSIWGKKNDGTDGDVVHTIGAYYNSSSGFAQGLNGYLAEIHWVEGAALAPTEFGEVDSASGIWKPKAYTGSYGTNGFYLNFDDSSALGADSSGNSNNWSLNNIAAADQATDTPTNSFATLNPLHRNSATASNNPILTEGATVHTSTLADYWQTSIATIGVTSGKWYFEAKIQDSNTTLVAVGMGDEGDIQTWGVGNGYLGAGKSLSYGSGSSAYTHSNIIGIAVDVDNGKVYWAKDNTYINSGNPAGNANGTAIPTGGVSNGTYFLGVSGYKLNGHAVLQVNFGGYHANSLSSAATDANGYGTFEYAPPTGYYALCTKNLAEYG